jgi:hypothetical protein
MCFHNYINQIKYFVLNILFRRLLKVSSVSHNGDVRELHGDSEQRRETAAVLRQIKR